MSTDFIALFDITLEGVSAHWLRAKLEVTPNFAQEVVEQYRDHWCPKVWAVETSPAGTAVNGLGGFAIRLKPGTLEMYHMMRFDTFAGDSSSRNALRRACFSLAEFVGSTRAIYTHALMPYDGEGLNQIESGLRARIGPPALSFEEMHAADHFGPRAWYIETFDDLRDSGTDGQTIR